MSDTEPLDLTKAESYEHECVSMSRPYGAEVIRELIAEVRRLREELDPKKVDYNPCAHGYDEGICAACYPITHHFFGGNA